MKIHRGKVVTIPARLFRLGCVETYGETRITWEHCAYIVYRTGKGCIWSGRGLKIARTVANRHKG